MKQQQMANNLEILILAAGKGTRMNSDTPKVLQPLLGIPMIEHVVEKSFNLKPKKITMIIHRGLTFLKKIYPKIDFIVQEPQLGTGHAVQIFVKKNKKIKNNLLVLYGDNPLIEEQDLKQIIFHLKKNDISLLGFEKKNNSSYGIIIENNNQVDEIVEYKDASTEQRKLKICNSGIMGLSKNTLSYIFDIKNNNNKKEYYLTDIVKISKKYNHSTKLIVAKNSSSALGINDMKELSVAEKILQESLRCKALKHGVHMKAPETVFLSKDTKFGKNVTIDPYVVIGSKVVIGNEVHIQSFTHIENAIIKNKVSIGPYARIRPGTILNDNSKIGNFVEIKNSKIDKFSKVNHLSYIGDADIGEKVNVGAGTITCNYDGAKKSKTKIKKNSFIGSNTSLVAPVIIGKNSIIGAGSVITKNVRDNKLALTRSEQKEMRYSKKNKKK
jgi:bifunctional UDP-N-acetylglucosamine pyrophosphorylase/glucosamine-1-phosphate N-acetyltransferase